MKYKPLHLESVFSDPFLEAGRGGGRAASLDPLLLCKNLKFTLHRYLYYVLDPYFEVALLCYDFVL